MLSRHSDEQAQWQKNKHFYWTVAVASENFIAAEANYWTDSQTFGKQESLTHQKLLTFNKCQMYVLFLKMQQISLVKV